MKFFFQFHTSFQNSHMGMLLISMNLACKITYLAIFFIFATIVTVVATIIVSKILLSSRQCRDKPKYM